MMCSTVLCCDHAPAPHTHAHTQRDKACSGSAVDHSRNSCCVWRNVDAVAVDVVVCVSVYVRLVWFVRLVVAPLCVWLDVCVVL